MKVRSIILGLSLIACSGCGPEMAMFLDGFNQGFSATQTFSRQPAYFGRDAHNQAMRDLTTSLRTLAEMP